MKTLSKLLVAVVALFTCACATDATEDLGVKLGGQTELTLSLEESRTQLGTAVDGLYPLYWSEGDIIAVNGVASEPLTAQQAGGNKATFSIPGELTAPFCIAYPAAPTGKVLFAKNQVHAGNSTFGNGVSTMYAYGDTTGIQLHHLTGVLKFGVKGSATLKKIQVSTVNAPIAGAFDCDFTTGKATPSTEAVNVINYTFNESADGEKVLPLSDEVQYIHVAVPAGEYNYLHVTLYDTENGVMSANIKADDEKPLDAGDVRYFSTPIEYAPNSSDFIIASFDDLDKFAKAVAAATNEAPFTQNALVVENITIPADAVWSPIEGFTNSFNGNGYTISGLKAPLFGTVTGGEIKNLKVADVALNITDYTFAGAIVCTLTSTATATAKISNCEAEGTINYSNNNVTVSANFDSTIINVGGLVGRGYGATIEDCVNYINITNNLATPANISTVKMYNSPSFGGVVGNVYVATAGTAKSIITGCKNYGSITVNDSKANETYTSPCLGGIAGCVRAETAEVRDCDNYGPIIIKSHGREPDAAGIAGRSYATLIDNCVNHAGGTISTNVISRYGFFGGIVANSYSKTISNCTNKADITYSPTKTSTGYQYIGGIAGHIRTNAHTITNCVNEGKITNTASLYNAVSNCYVHIGGIVGYGAIGGKITYCENKAEILISGIKGNQAMSGVEKNTAAHNAVGGILGYSAKGDLLIDNCTNHSNGVINYNIQIYGKGNISHHGVGGIIGRATGDITNCVNNAAININTSTLAVADTMPATTIHAGGCAGYAAGKMTNCTNKGAVTFPKEATAYGYCIAGVAGLGKAGFENCHNEGAISVYGDAIDSDRTLSSNKVGGIAGFGNGVMSGCTNKATGTITVTGKMFPSGAWCNENAGTSIGGIVAHKNGKTSGCINYGAVNVTLNLEQGAAAMIGAYYISGLCGYSGAVWENSTNEGAVSVDGEYNVTATRYAQLCICGGISRIAAVAYTNLDNKAKITVNVTSSIAHNDHSNDPNHLLVGGVFSGFGGSEGISDCDNSGDIEIGEGTNFEKVYVIAGGIAGKASSGNNLTNCHNSGNIVMKGAAGYGAILGGLMGQYNAEGVVSENCSNSGNITVTRGEKGENVIKATYIGGLAGSQSSKVVAVTNFVNSGDIIFKGKSTDVCRLGGIVGSNTQNATSWSGLVNTGDISHEGETSDSKTFVGGIIGSANKGIVGAKSHCAIKAVGYTNVGMILGCARVTDSVIASNCELGGTICTTTEDKEDIDGGISKVPMVVEITADNYFDYIYSGTTAWEGTDYDGCSFLSVKPTV